MYGGILSGFRYARQTIVWTALYVGTEAILDRVRGTVDFLNTTAAAASSAALFSWRNGFSRQLTVRTIRLSGTVGLGLGLLQDTLIYAKGGRIWYLEKIFQEGPKETTSAR